SLWPGYWPYYYLPASSACSSSYLRQPSNCPLRRIEAIYHYRAANRNGWLRWLPDNGFAMAFRQKLWLRLAVPALKVCGLYLPCPLPQRSDPHWSGSSLTYLSPPLPLNSQGLLVCPSTSPLSASLSVHRSGWP